MIPVLFHSLRHYDAHLIIGSEHEGIEKASIIPQQGEQVMAFSSSNLQFIDSLSFLLSSLDVAVKSLSTLWRADDTKSIARVFPHLVKAFSEEYHDCNNLPHIEPSDPRFLLLLSKGIMPYKFMTGPEAFAACSLPPIEAFRSSLTNETVTEEDYRHAQLVWDELECKTTTSRSTSPATYTCSPSASATCARCACESTSWNR